MLTALLLSFSAMALQVAPDAAPATDGDPAIARPADAPLPSAYHLSSYSSMRAARLGADGSLDSGAGVLVLLDGASGEPLAANQLRFGPMPDLWAAWRGPLGEARVEVKAAALAVSRAGDERVRAVLRLTITSKLDTPQTISLAASLRAGGGDPLQRPFPSLPFDPASAWARDGQFLTRDGRAVLSWTGLEPQVTLNEAVAAPDAEVARLTWTLELQPGSPRLLELSLAGPPATATVDEAAFRDGFTRWSFLQLEEQLGWQSRERGAYADIALHDMRMWYALVGALHSLRSYGDAHNVVEAFSDRPFGHPASDGAFEAEVICVFAEWGFDAWAADFHKKLLAEVETRAQGLSPARRVALVHGLARSIRLGTDPQDQQALAAAIRALVGPDAEGAAVRPWLDPEQVRLDLQSVLEDAGATDGYALPHFAWDQPAAGSTEAALQAGRRAISAHDGNTAWAALAPLVARTTDDGQGCLVPGGVPDATYHLAFASLVREVLIDDHGPDLHVFPALGRGMVPPRGAIETTALPTRYGLLQTQSFYVAKKLYGTKIVRLGTRPPAQVLWHLPTGLQVEAIAGPLGGTATLRPDGLVECVLDPRHPAGLRFNIKLKTGS